VRLSVFFLAAAALFAQDAKIIPLYPGPAPGSENWTWQEQDIVGPQDNVRRTHNVTCPTLTLYLPPASSATGTAVIVCPGGGFRYLAIDYEGHDAARWLNSLGVAAFVLKYRVMQTGDPGEKDRATVAARWKETLPLAVADAQQAIRVVRSRAAEWGLSTDRIGILGFSAGGYITAAAALHYDAASRPSFAAPIYPALPEDVTPPADAPPLFLAQADDDRLVSPLNNTVRLYTAWKKANIPAEMHIYSKGGHGFGMRKSPLPVATWPDRFRDWLGVQGLLQPVGR
jgi:acetyl esterase/lipase